MFDFTPAGRLTRKKAVVLVAGVALLFAALASWGVYHFLQTETTKARAVPGDIVIAAATDIPIGTPIEPTHLKNMTWPKGTAPTGCFGDPRAIVGRVAIKHISAGDIITENRMMPREGSNAVMTYIVPQGHRAVTVSVNEVAGVAGFISPNNKVDVVLTGPLPGSETGESISKIVLQNVPVLAVGQLAEQKDGKPSVAPTVTLDLTPEDAEKLVLSSHKGSLQLLLRNIVDTAKVDSHGATIYQVLNGVGQAPRSTPVKPKTSSPPRKSSPPSISVEVIKGKERATKEFPELAAAKSPEATSR